VLAFRRRVRYRAAGMQRRCSAWVIILLPVAAGCGAVGARSDGEPVGVVLEASGDVPALEMALMVQPASAAQTLLEPVTGALHAALSSCATQGLGALETGLSLAFEVRDGRARLQREPARGLAQCVSEALLSKLPAARDVQSFDVRMRAAHASASTEGRADHAP
jgi:hypothetical protein